MRALLVLLLAACGAPPTPAPSTGSTPMRPVSPLTIDGPAPVDDAICVGDHCDTRDVARPLDIRPVEEGLILDFAADVSPVDARHVVLHCRTVEDGPSAAGTICPVDLGALEIDVQEGPAGMTLMIHIGPGADRKALRQWYEAHFK